ncbi:MAG: inositol monophosphatase [Phototrophicales bacterium]|nr:MAG: inositol monophosphatase [Phototrophicales bacterium]
MLNSALKTAIDIAYSAGEILRDGFSQPHRINQKADATDLVTETDQAAEKLIIECLRSTFPDHSILGEEGGAQNVAEAQYRWIIDPLDGTTNFAHGIPHFSVSIALVDAEGWPIVGVIYDPTRDECFAASKGNGATLNGQPIHVSRTPKLSQAVVASGFPYDKWHDPRNNADLWAHFVVRSRGVRRFGSAALDLAYVAAGRFDGYWEQKLNAWDIMAGVLLVQEAGGNVSGFDGTSAFIHAIKPDIVASNGLFHEEILTVIRLGEKAPRPI